MPETGRPFFPPGPWFNSPNDGTPPSSAQTTFTMPFIAAHTTMYSIPTPLEINVSFKSSVTTVPQIWTNPTTLTATGTFVVPPSITAVEIEAYAGGAGGAVAGGANHGANGGGGGAYSQGTLAVTAGNSYTATVGAAGGPGANGGDSSFTGDSASVVAKGGQAGGTGGQASAGTGTIKNSGGNGGAEFDTSGCGGSGGGGGAGNSGSGGNGSQGSPSGGTGGAGGTGGVTDGGAGGLGGHFLAGSPQSQPGVFPGGGGGGTGGFSSGGSFTDPGASGGGGQIRISWKTIYPGLITPNTHVYSLAPWLNVPRIGPKGVFDLFDLWSPQTGTGPGNGGELFGLMLAPNGTSYTATLAASIGTTDTSLTLTGDSAFPSGAQLCVLIDSEYLFIKQVSLGLYRIMGRAASNSTVASHSSSANVTWNDTYDMAITAGAGISHNFTANIDGSGSQTYYGFLICFDSSQAYLGTSRYPMHVTSVRGVFTAGASQTGTNAIDAAQGNKVCVPAALSDNCPAALSNPALITTDISAGQVAVVRYQNPEASIMTLGPRSCSLQSWFGLKRVNSSDVDVTLTDPTGTVIDGTEEGSFLDPSSIGINPETGGNSVDNIAYTSVTLPGSSRTFTHGGSPSPPNYNEKGWPIGILAVRQGTGRVPIWKSFDWKDYNYVYAGFAPDATFAQFVVNNNGIIFGSNPIINLPGSQDITGPDAMWDDGNHYFSTCIYVAIFGQKYAVVGPSIGGGVVNQPNTPGPGYVPTVSFPSPGSPTVTTPTVTTQGGTGGGQTPPPVGPNTLDISLT